ncbi:MAG TPA: DNA repair protein RadC [Parachlamydiaceae bacterium]|nr:DNA repair protein RadC [Parachlamydiaceae bacterium]
MNQQDSSYSIQQMPPSERPRERLIRFGPESLTAAELIAIILGSGTKQTPVLQLAQLMIAKFGNLQQLADATIQELCQVKGIGHAKAIQLRAVFNLGLRLSKQNISAKYKIEHPAHAYNLVKDELLSEKRELFVVILQDAKGCSLGHHIVSIGTLTETPVHPREVFYPAIRHKAVSIILVHNHPSGDLTPSRQDCELTRQLIAVGHMVGIPVNDHIIISDQGYLSLRQRGGIFDAEPEKKHQIHSKSN